MRKFALLASITFLLAGCAVAQDETTQSGGDCDGIRVVVDFDILNSDKIDTCVSIDGETAPASEVLAQAGVTTVGTATYGDAVVCRVNGLPSETEAFTVEGEDPYLESCADMSPAFAYWALWTITDAEISWDYATQGVGTLVLSKGQSIGLIFSTAGEVPNPDRS
jgi:hypothetical protein